MRTGVWRPEDRGLPGMDEGTATATGSMGRADNMVKIRYWEGGLMLKVAKVEEDMEEYVRGMG